MSELADEIEAQGEAYLRTLQPAWTGTNHDEALALVIVVADNLPAILQALRDGEKLWAELAKRPSLSLQTAPSEHEGEPLEWVVYRENGGVNDREFTEIARAATPDAAIRQALTGEGQ